MTITDDHVRQFYDWLNRQSSGPHPLFAKYREYVGDQATFGEANEVLQRGLSLRLWVQIHRSGDHAQVRLRQ